MTNLFSLDNKKILVTGSTRGLGFLLAKGLAQHGAEIIVNGTQTESTQKAAEALRAEGFIAHAVSFDVTNSQAVNQAIDHIESKIGPIDVLINNAGIQRRHKFTEFPEKDGTT